MGRPVSYDVETARAYVIAELTKGRSLVKICEEPGMPARDTVLYWQRQNPEFSAECARAREDGLEVHVDKCHEIEQGVLNGEIAPDAARVVISSVQWRASKLKSKIYGDKTQIDATVKHSWADFVEEVAAKRLAEAKVIEGEIVDEPGENE